jgi:DNA-binding response OmpR family regulator
MNDTEKKSLVLIVDDHRPVLRFIEINLKLNGFEVITTTSGAEALEIIKTENPDIMLLDIVIPELDGFEVLRQLRAFNQMPVIAISARSDNYNKAMELGANVFIIKPLNVDELSGRIKELLGR